MARKVSLHKQPYHLSSKPRASTWALGRAEVSRAEPSLKPAPRTQGTQGTRPDFISLLSCLQATSCGPSAPPSAWPVHPTNAGGPRLGAARGGLVEGGGREWAGRGALPPRGFSPGPEPQRGRLLSAPPAAHSRKPAGGEGALPPGVLRAGHVMGAEPRGAEAVTAPGRGGGELCFEHLLCTL